MGVPFSGCNSRSLEAMDGLDGDADITFILTTNRPDLLERALVERPGRVDLAVQIDKPDLDGRLPLFELYGRDLLLAGQLSEAAVQEAARRTEGITASFTKEAIRRTVVTAARPAALRATMLSDAETFTRTLLGGGEFDPARIGDTDLMGDDFEDGDGYPSSFRIDVDWVRRPTWFGSRQPLDRPGSARGSRSAEPMA